MSTNRGIALVTVLLVSSIVCVIALGLSLLVAVEHLTMRNYRESAALLHAAEGGVDLAAGALARAPAWDAVLAGLQQADGVDGPPNGTRDMGATSIDLDAQTQLLNCGHPAACSPGELQSATTDRPWGANNPLWRLYLYGPLASLGPFRYPPDAYLLVWVADDGRETDGDPERDADEPSTPGNGILRVRAEAFGRAGGRRGVEAELRRICRMEGGSLTCLPGIRVQSWRDVRHVVP